MGGRARAQPGFRAAQRNLARFVPPPNEAVMLATALGRCRCTSTLRWRSRPQRASLSRAARPHRRSRRLAHRRPGKRAAPSCSSATHFELKGRLAVAAGKEGFNARLRWQQEARTPHSRSMGRSASAACASPTNGPTSNVLNSRGQHLDSDAARREIQTRGSDSSRRLRACDTGCRACPIPRIPPKKRSMSSSASPRSARTAGRSSTGATPPSTAMAALADDPEARRRARSACSWTAGSS